MAIYKVIDESIARLTDNLEFRGTSVTNGLFTSTQSIVEVSGSNEAIGCCCF